MTFSKSISVWEIFALVAALAAKMIVMAISAASREAHVNLTVGDSSYFFDD
jgi:hypothetical protein